MRKLLFLLTLFITFQAFAIDVTIGRTRIEQNVVSSQGNKCLVAHCNLKIQGLRGKECDLLLMIEDDQGNWHKNANGNYVSEFKRIKCNYEPSTWTDIKVYIRNDKLAPKNGNHTYKVYLMVRYNGNKYGSTFAGSYTMQGSNKVVCNWCKGEGRVTCTSCGGTHRGVVPGQTCFWCSNDGTIQCIICKGTGYKEAANSGNYAGNGGSNYTPIYNGNSGNSSSSSGSQQRQCPACHGTGQGLDEVVYPPSYTSGIIEEYCGKCGRVCPQHSHVQHTCRTCYGRGYL